MAGKLVYNVKISREDLKKKIAKEKDSTGKSVYRIVEDALVQYFEGGKA